MRHVYTLFTTVFAGLISLPLVAEEFKLSMPVDCTLGETCYIQNYVDADPSEGYQDFKCRHLSYNGHKGTDFAVRSHLEAIAGVQVLAAAPGRVHTVRDQVKDQFLGQTVAIPKNQDCGNGIVIKHQDGWETQYCHLRQGSITVKPGENVDAGSPLGLIGMTGRTAFPHLHLSLRKDGKPIDPFEPVDNQTCGADLSDQLWSEPMNYESAGLLQTGFSYRVPNYDHVKWGYLNSKKIYASQKAIVLWAHVFGAQTGDVLELEIQGPEGTFFSQKIVFEKPQAQAMRAGGRKLHADNTILGDYTGIIRLMRDGQIIDTAQVNTLLLE